MARYIGTEQDQYDFDEEEGVLPFTDTYQEDIDALKKLDSNLEFSGALRKALEALSTDPKNRESLYEILYQIGTSDMPDTVVIAASAGMSKYIKTIRPITVDAKQLSSFVKVTLGQVAQSIGNDALTLLIRPPSRDVYTRAVEGLLERSAVLSKENQLFRLKAKAKAQLGNVRANLLDEKTEEEIETAGNLEALLDIISRKPSAYSVPVLNDYFESLTVSSSIVKFIGDVRGTVNASGSSSRLEAAWAATLASLGMANARFKDIVLSTVGPSRWPSIAPFVVTEVTEYGAYLLTSAFRIVDRLQKNDQFVSKPIGIAAAMKPYTFENAAFVRLLVALHYDTIKGRKDGGIAASYDPNSVLFRAWTDLTDAKFVGGEGRRPTLILD